MKKLMADFRASNRTLQEFGDGLLRHVAAHQEYIESAEKQSDVELARVWNLLIEDELKRTKAQQKKEASELTILLKEMLEIDLGVVMVLKNSFMFELKEYGAISFRGLSGLSNAFETFDVVVTTIISEDAREPYSQGAAPTVVEVTVSGVADGKIQQVIANRQPKG